MAEKEKLCPNCGHCPTCGRSNRPPVVVYPHQWPYPWPWAAQPRTPYVTWGNNNPINQSTTTSTLQAYN